MPLEVREALERAGLRPAYDARPPYQRNDYLGWIARAKRPETRARRLAQMLEELQENVAPLTNAVERMSESGIRGMLDQRAQHHLLVIAEDRRMGPGLRATAEMRDDTRTVRTAIRHRYQHIGQKRTKLRLQALVLQKQSNNSTH